MKPRDNGPGVDFENIEEVGAALVVYEVASEIADTNPSGTFMGVPGHELAAGASILRSWRPEFFYDGFTSTIGLPDVHAGFTLASAVEIVRPDKAEAIASFLGELIRITGEIENTHNS